MPTYLTWYEFKKDLERQVGHFVVNSDWLKIKPREPLPWNDASMKSALDGLAEMKRVGRKPGSYVLTNRIKKLKSESDCLYPIICTRTLF